MDPKWSSYFHEEENEDKGKKEKEDDYNNEHDYDDGDDDDDDDDDDDYNDEEEEEEEEDDKEENNNDKYDIGHEGECSFGLPEDTVFYHEPYNQFERLEYEALAEKKRKALAELQCEGLVKKVRVEDVSRANMEQMMTIMNYGAFRKSRKTKKRGRKKGSKNKLNSEVVKKLGQATLYYAHGRYDEAISLLDQIVLQAPQLPDAYHTLGLVYKALGDVKRAFNFYMIAAHLMPKNPSIWMLLYSLSREEGDLNQAVGFLSKAITADPKDIQLRFLFASLYLEHGNYQIAARTYYQIHQISPENVEALKIAAQLYKRCGQLDRSINILEEYLNDHPPEADLSVVDLLTSLLMDSKDHGKAFQHIERSMLVYCKGKELPLELKIRAGICHAHLGNVQEAEVLFGALEGGSSHQQTGLITEVANSLVNLGHYSIALKYYLTLERIDRDDKGPLHLKIADCYLALKERLKAIMFFEKALVALPDDIDARLRLASLLLEESRHDEAIALLSPPSNSNIISQHSGKPKPWWLNEKVKLKLCHIYRAKGMLKDFVDAIFPLVHESLYYCEKYHEPKVTGRTELTTENTDERDKEINCGTEELFHRSRRMAPTLDPSKAPRTKEQKTNVLAPDVDEPVLREHRAPFPNILKDEEHHDLMGNLCEALATLRRYSNALEIISLTLKLGNNILSTEKKEQLRVLGAQLAYNSVEPKHGFEFVKYIVNQHPYSIAAWNCYYKVISRLENRDTRHFKFLQSMQRILKDCVPAILISAHQFTITGRHQDAARKYLEAYKLLPENPLVNLCVGTALIDVALGFRLQNKHQTLAQGLAFLYNNLRFCQNSQEALYNIARAYHHVGLVSLATSYYEKVLATHEKDFPIPSLPNENISRGTQRPGYCDLRREAAYNLHLIYKRSGAYDLSRQVLRDYCTF